VVILCESVALNAGWQRPSALADVADLLVAFVAGWLSEQSFS